MKGRDPVLLKSFLLSKFIEIFRIERGSVVALYSLWSSVGGEDVFKYFLVGLEVGCMVHSLPPGIWFSCQSGQGCSVHLGMVPHWSMEIVSQVRVWMLVTLIGSSLSLFVATWHS